MLTDVREKPDPARQRQAVDRLTQWLGTDYLIDQYRTLQNQIALEAGTPNHDIHDQRLANGTPNFTAVPHSMFFYYVRLDSDGKLRVDHYFYVDGDRAYPSTWKPIPYYEPGLLDLVGKLAVNARPIRRHDPRERDPPRDAAVNFRDIEWTHKSYIAIFLDEANWCFHKFPAEDSAVVFITEPKNGKTGTVNHSFFDAIDLGVTMPILRPKQGGPTSDERSAVVFVNHMKGDDIGTDLAKDASEFFQFKMFIDVKFAVDDGTPMTIILDPDGTNLGPPVPPPA